MQLSLFSRTSLVQGFAAAAQAACETVLDFSIGAVLRAIGEAQATLSLWFQVLLLNVLSMTRLATSSGTDVDSWVGDFGLTRQPAVAATGQVTLSRYVATVAALIVPGVQVKTTDGTQTFTVTADPTNPAWSTTQGALPGYFMPIGTASVTVPVQAVNAGVQGNIGAGTISLVASAVAGVDTVTNAIAFTNGVNAESDAALKASFLAFILSLPATTNAALEYAASQVQQGLLIQVASAVPQPGFTTIYVDDGSGAPSASLLSTVYTACAPVAAEGITLLVVGPTTVPVTVTAILNLVPGASAQVVQANVNTALAAYIEQLGFGATLPYLNTAGVILGVSGVASIAALVLNGGAADITADIGQRIVATSISVT